MLVKFCLACSIINLRELSTLQTQEQRAKQRNKLANHVLRAVCTACKTPWTCKKAGTYDSDIPYSAKAATLDVMKIRTLKGGLESLLTYFTSYVSLDIYFSKMAKN
mgnify:CR=1 FL=1